MHKIIKWTHSERQIDDLKPAAYNPRKLTEDQAKQLTESIDRFGLCDPIIINQDNTVIGGHQRLKIMKQRGEQTVPVYVPDRALDVNEEKELNVRLNKNLGEWDLSLLSSFDEDMLKSVGFTSDELDKIFCTQVDEKENIAPAVREETDTKSGDIFQLGEHRLMCGSSGDMSDVTILMSGKQADMVFTDPPYGVAYKGKTKDALEIENDDVDEDKLGAMLRDWFDSVDNILRGGAIYWPRSRRDRYTFYSLMIGSGADGFAR